MTIYHTLLVNCNTTVICLRAEAWYPPQPRMNLRTARQPAQKQSPILACTTGRHDDKQIPVHHHPKIFNNQAMVHSNMSCLGNAGGILPRSKGNDDVSSRFKFSHLVLLNTSAVEAAVTAAVTSLFLLDFFAIPSLNCTRFVFRSKRWYIIFWCTRIKGCVCAPRCRKPPSFCNFYLLQVFVQPRSAPGQLPPTTAHTVNG